MKSDNFLRIDSTTENMIPQSERDKQMNEIERKKILEGIIKKSKEYDPSDVQPTKLTKALSHHK